MFLQHKDTRLYKTVLYASEEVNSYVNKRCYETRAHANHKHDDPSRDLLRSNLLQ